MGFKDRILAERYAQALLDIVSAENKAADTMDDLNALKNILQTTPGFMKFLCSPKADEQKKRSLVSLVLEGKISDVLYKFLHLLIKKRRADIFLDVVEGYEKLYDEQERCYRVKVITAVALSEQVAEILKQRLVAVCGQDIKLGFDVDASIIGGMIIKTHTKCLDGSVRNQLYQIKEKLHNLRV